MHEPSRRFIISVTLTAPGYNPGTGYDASMTLNAGQTYQLAENGPWPGRITIDGDISGALITASLPLAVFGGAQLAYVWDDVRGGAPSAPAGANYNVQQLPPDTTWGTHFVTEPLAGRQKGDTFRILANTNNTSVMIKGTLVTTLRRRGWYV